MSAPKEQLAMMAAIVASGAPFGEPSMQVAKRSIEVSKDIVSLLEADEAAAVPDVTDQTGTDTPVPPASTPTKGGITKKSN